MKINSDKISLVNFFIDNNGGVFNVPYYQRNYSWEEKQVSTMLNDIFYSKEKYKNKKNHFFGVIVSKEYEEDNEKQFELIDGQQRLATLSIFVKCLIKYITEKNWVVDSDYLNKLNLFLWKTNKEENNRKIRLQLDNEQKDNTVYNQILNDDNVTYTDNLINLAYLNINSYLKNKLNLSQDTIAEHIKTFFDMQIVHIILEVGEDNPQNVFESLNSKGKDLSNVDLIKNYLFMNIERKKRQNELYNIYWKPIEENIKDVKSIERFFRDLLTIKTKKANDKTENIYEEFKDYYKKINDSDIEQKLKEINYWMRLYVSATKWFENSNIKSDQKYKEYKHINEVVSKTYGFISTDLVTVIYMYFGDKLLNDQNFKNSFDSIIEILDKYIVRWNLNMRSSKGHLYGPLVKIIHELELLELKFNEEEKNNTKQKFAYVKEIKNIILKKLTTQQSAYVPDDEIKSSLKLLTHEKLGKYIIKKIEQWKSGINQTENYTTEHIRPKSKEINLQDNSWEFEQFHDKIVNKIGNLAFMEKSLNGEASDKSFIEKKQIYLRSQSYTLESVDKTLEIWNSDEMDKRTEKICNDFLEIFSIN